MNKKVLTIGGIVVLVVLLVLTMSIKPKEGAGEVKKTVSNDPNVILSNAEKESAAVKEDEKGEFIQIDIDKYLEYYNGSEAKIILLARPTCHYCQIAEPIIQKLVKDYNLEVNYLNTDNFTEDTQATFVQSDEAFSEGFGTPYLFIVKDSSIVDSVDGLTDTAHYESFFSTNGFIE